MLVYDLCQVATEIQSAYLYSLGTAVFYSSDNLYALVGRQQHHDIFAFAGFSLAERLIEIKTTDPITVLDGLVNGRELR